MIIVLIVCLSLKSTLGGLLGALLLVVVSESLIEGMEDNKKTTKKPAPSPKIGDKDKDGKDEDEDKEGDDEKEPEAKKHGHGKAKTGKADTKKPALKKPAGPGGKKGTEELKNMLGGTDLVGLTEKFSKLRSLADAINRSQ